MAAVALLIDYVVTIAVQTAAGSTAIVSAFPWLSRLPVVGPKTLLVGEWQRRRWRRRAPPRPPLRPRRPRGPRLARRALAPCRIRGDRVTVQGQLRTVQVRPAQQSNVLACEVADGGGDLTAMFYGRTHIPGLEPGGQIRLHGMAGVSADGRAVMVNPEYELIR